MRQRQEVDATDRPPVFSIGLQRCTFGLDQLVWNGRNGRISLMREPNRRAMHSPKGVENAGSNRVGKMKRIEILRGREASKTSEFPLGGLGLGALVEQVALASEVDFHAFLDGVPRPVDIDLKPADLHRRLALSARPVDCLALRSR